MKIRRDGIEYELTYEEMRKAYDELDEFYIIEDIKSRYEKEDMPGITYQDLQEIARRINRTLENNDSYWESYWLSVKYTVEAYLKEKNN